jgi:tRNA pseudouridine38-40 synthase
LPAGTASRDRGATPLVLTARLDLEYDGGGFAGWARQPGRRTVQAVLEQALADAGPSVGLTVAGRTDAGVHARGQVASHPGAAVPAARLNALLPPDVRVLRSETAPDGFDARAAARSRTYRYRVLVRAVESPFEAGRSLHWPRPLDLDALRDCAERLPGRHDFTAFTPSQTDHVRFEREVSRAEWVEAGGSVLELWIEADTFLRHMVRVLVGTMLEVGAGRRGAADFGRLLEGRPRAEAGPTASAHGLYLESVRY